MEAMEALRAQLAQLWTQLHADFPDIPFVPLQWNAQTSAFYAAQICSILAEDGCPRRNVRKQAEEQAAKLSYLLAAAGAMLNHDLSFEQVLPIFGTLTMCFLVMPPTDQDQPWLRRMMDAMSVRDWNTMIPMLRARLKTPRPTPENLAHARACMAACQHPEIIAYAFHMLLRCTLVMG